MKRNSQKETSLLKLGTFLMFLALTFLLLYFYLNRQGLFQLRTSEKSSKEVEIGENVLPSVTPKPGWEEYKNEDFSFRFERPKFLYERVYKDQGGYLLFIRFEETKFSIEKGLAIGISTRSPEEEVENTKSALMKDGAKLVNEEKIEVAEQEGTRLDFEPEGEGEKRSVVIFVKDNYSYSISTTPEQIDRVIESFRFL